MIFNNNALSRLAGRRLKIKNGDRNERKNKKL